MSYDGRQLSIPREYLYRVERPGALAALILTFGTTPRQYTIVANIDNQVATVRTQLAFARAAGHQFRNDATVWHYTNDFAVGYDAEGFCIRKLRADHEDPFMIPYYLATMYAHVSFVDDDRMYIDGRRLPPFLLARALGFGMVTLAPPPSPTLTVADMPALFLAHARENDTTVALVM